MKFFFQGLNNSEKIQKVKKGMKMIDTSLTSEVYSAFKVKKYEKKFIEVARKKNPDWELLLHELKRKKIHGQS